MLQKVIFTFNSIFIACIESHKIKILYHCTEYLKIFKVKTTKNVVLFRIILNYHFFNTFFNICLYI